MTTYSQTVGPNVPSSFTNTGNWNDFSNFDRSFTVISSITLKSVKAVPVNHWSLCSGATSSLTIDLYKDGVRIDDVSATVNCGVVNTIDLNFELLSGFYELRIRNVDNGQMALSTDASEKSITNMIFLNEQPDGFSGAFFDWVVEGKTGPVIPLPDTVRLCPGQTYDLNFGAYNGERWISDEPFTTIDDANIRLEPTQSTVYYFEKPTLIPAGENIVLNGDFEAGNTGFTSEYTLNTALTTRGDYIVGNDASIPLSVGADYNPGTTSGNMLVTKATPAGSGVKDAWCQTIDVFPNTTYQAEFRVKSGAFSNNPFITASFNGGNWNFENTGSTWALYNQTWNSGSNTTLEYCIQNHLAETDGNIMLIDDVKLLSADPILAYSAVDQVVVIVESASTIDLGADANNCDLATSPVTLDAGSDWDSYTWSPGGQTSQTISVNAPGTYLVATTKSGGCTGTGDITFTANACTPTCTNPNYILMTGLQPVCQGGTADFDLNITAGTAPFTIYYSIDGVAQTPLTGLALGTHILTMNSTQSTIRVDSVNGGGCTTKHPFIVASSGISGVNPLPSIDLGNITTICDDGTTPLTLDAGNSGATYAWAPNNETSQTITVNAAGTYEVTVTNDNNCSNTESITITETPCGSVCSSDNDNDGVCDDVDLDDDNDGILDTEECSAIKHFSVDWGNGGMGQTTDGASPTGFTRVQLTSSGPTTGFPTVTTTDWETITATNNVPNVGKAIKKALTITSNSDGAQIMITLPKFLENPVLFFNNIDGAGSLDFEFTPLTTIELVDNSVGVIITDKVVSYDAGSNDANDGFAIRLRGNVGIILITITSTIVDELGFNYLERTLVSCDTDNDLLPDYLDSDSDNDGCLDAIEGDGGFLLTDLAGETLSGQVDANGIPQIAAGGQFKGSSTDDESKANACACDVDTDNDGICDGVDLDDDNDGILDIIECPNRDETIFFDKFTGRAEDAPNAILPIGWIGQWVVGSGSPDLISESFDVCNFPLTHNSQNSGNIVGIGSSIAGFKESTKKSINGLVAGQDYYVSFEQSIMNGDPARCFMPGTGQVEIVFGGQTLRSPTMTPSLEKSNIPFQEVILGPFTAGNITEELIISATANNDGIGTNYILVDAVRVFIKGDPCDTDNDGIDNYLDPDSDNDGCFDALEGDGGILLTQIDSDGAITGGVDPVTGIPTAVGVGQADVSSTDAATQDAECATICTNDNDNDGVCDDVDLDDDNDGILDTEECIDEAASWDFETPLVPSGQNNNKGQTFQDWNLVGSGWINLIRPPYGTNVPQTASTGNQYVEVAGSGNFERLYTVTAPGKLSVEIDFASWGSGTETTQIKIFEADGITLIAQSPLITTPPPSDWNNAWQHTGRVSTNLNPGNYIIRFLLGNFQAFDNVRISSATVATCDTDNDGIINSLDFDSDDDGCPDALEGSASFTNADISNTMLTGGVDANGVPTVATASGQGLGTSQDDATQSAECCDDFDNDGVCDDLDLDDDNDGILDTEECPTTQVSTTFSTGGGTTTLFNAPAADRGFQFNIYSLDNSFNLNINGVDLVSREVQCSGSGVSGESLLVFTADNSGFGQSGNANVWTINGDINSPVIIVSIDENGEVSFSGKRNSSALLEAMKIIDSHPQPQNISWNADGPNNIILSQTVVGPTNISGEGFGVLSGTKCDDDNDGIANYLDTDSDDDGCFDALEGNGGILPSQLGANGMITGGVDANGIPLAVSGGQGDLSSTDDAVLGPECTCTPPVEPIINEMVNDTIQVCTSNSTKDLADYIVGTNVIWYTTASSNDGTSTSPVIDNSVVGITEYWVTQTIDCESNRVRVLYNVNAIPNLTITSPAPICAPLLIDLTAAGVTSGSTLNGGSLTYYSDTEATLPLSTPTAVSTGTYYILASNGYCSDTAEVNVTVNSKPSLVITDPIPVCEPALIDLTTASVTDGSNLEGGTLSYYTDANATMSYATPSTADSLSYYIVVSTPDMCYDTAQVNAVVYSTPILTINEPAAICSPLTINLKDVMITNGSKLGGGTLSYYTNAAATSSYLTPTNASSGEYFIVANTDFCSDTATVNVTIYAQPSIDLGDDIEACVGTNMTLDAQNSGATYTWNNLSTNQTLTVTTSGTYHVEVTNEGICIDRDTIEITIYEYPDFETTPLLESCDEKIDVVNAVSNITPATTNLKYYSNNLGTNELTTTQYAAIGTHTVYIQAENGVCNSQIKSINATIKPRPNAPLPAALPLCEGGELELYVQLPENVDYFAWLKSDQSYISNGETYLVTSNASTADEGNYYVYASLNGCLSDTNAITVALQDAPSPIIGLDGNDLTPGQQLILCPENLPLELYVANTPYPATWTLNTEVTEPSISEGTNGEFVVTVFDGVCSGSTNVLVEIEDFELTAYTDFDVINLGESVSLEAEGDDLVESTVQWYNFENNLIGSDTPFEFTPELTDSYHAIAYSENNCVDTAYTNEVTVYLPINIPTAFSPNGDGINDEWEIEGIESYSNISIKVFNRWGSLVYQSNGSYENWDGKNSNGGAATNGTYYYVISLISESNQTYSGDVSILK